MTATKITFVQTSTSNLQAFNNGAFLANVMLTRVRKSPTGRPAYVAHEARINGQEVRATDRTGLRAKILKALAA
jgi:hypothetical protein